MDAPLISVIVPVYKVEKYLDRCVQSIVDQTYRNLEIILVDDGSPDNCGSLCDAWAAKDSRIKVIHKENGGGAQARNMGLDSATGQYVGFVDSDDYIHPEMYQHLYDILQRTQSDIVECGYILTENDECVIKHLAESNLQVFSAEEALRENINDLVCRQLVWNKLYATKTLENIRFVEGKFIDDEFFTYRAIGNAKSIAVSDRIMYCYRQQSNSVMHQQFSRKWLDALEAKLCRLEYIQEHFPALEERAKVNLLFSGLYQMQQCLRYLAGEERKYVASRILKIAAKAQPYPVKPDLSLKQKVWFSLARMNMPLAGRVRNWLGIGL